MMDATPPAARIPRRERGWARTLSDVLSPPLVWAVTALAVAAQGAESTGAALGGAALYGVLVCLAPALYIGYMVWRGHITDIHIRERSQRLRPFLVTMLGALTAFGLLTVLKAPPLLPTLALFSIVQVGVMCAITLVWQISMHTMSIAGAVVIAGGLYGLPVGLALAPLIPAVSAARVRLDRHTPAQVIAGSVVGCALTAAMFALSQAGG
jgi:membrane-associated phospholipid phosphatase